jgi:hypothetical protein
MNQFQCLVVRTIFFSAFLLGNSTIARDVESDEESSDRSCLAPRVDENTIKELGQIFFNMKQPDYIEGEYIHLPNNQKKAPKDWTIDDVNVELLVREWTYEYKFCCYNYPDNCIERIRKCNCDCEKSYTSSARACDAAHCITCAAGFYFCGRAICCKIPDWERYLAFGALIEPVLYCAMRFVFFIRGDHVRKTIKNKVLEDQDIQIKILGHARTLAEKQNK